jgi:hypothetical protein
VRIITTFIFTACALSSVVIAQSAGGPGVKRDSERMERSLTQILIRAGMPPAKGKSAPPLRTTFTDAELNAWLIADGKENVPVGLVQPKVTFTAPGKLSVVAMVDLDAVRTSKKDRGWLDPLAYFTGMMMITLQGSLSGSGGQGIFDVESAALGNVPVPRALIQELITFYSKSPDFPNGIALARPFPLPSGVRELVLVRGSATVVQ